MSVTHQDVINYIEMKYCSNTMCSIRDDKLIIWFCAAFDEFNFNTLPDNIVFMGRMYMANSLIETLPEDIIIKNSLTLTNSAIKTLPVLNIGVSLDLSDTHIVPQDGTYIGDTIFATNSLYDHLNELEIYGYFFSTGLLS